MVRWSRIAAECGGYRDGFVAVYKRHEGQDTDEVDGRGRPVKVTVSSFARHAGISPGTFQDWVDRARRGRPRDRTLEEVRRADAGRAEQIVREAAKKHPQAVRKVYVEQAPSPTPAERREAAAHADRLTSPAKAAAAPVTDGALALLREARDEIREIQEPATKAGMRALRKAHAEVGEELEALAFRSELEEEVMR